MSKKSEKLTEREEARKELLKLLKPGATVYTISRHVSSSGMSRVIDLVIPVMKTDTATQTVNDARATAQGRRAFKVGATGYPDKGPNAFRTGQISAIHFAGRTVTFDFPAHAHGEASSETVDFDAARVYVKSKPYPAVRSIGWLAARAMDRRFVNDRHYGIQIGGCGMDMGFALVYDLGAALWPKGTKKPHSTRNGEPDTAGGYALKHVWL